MVRDTAGGSERSLAEWARDICTTMGARVEMLSRMGLADFADDDHFQYEEDMELSHHAEIIGIIELALALVAVMHPMADGIHVLLGRP